MGKYTSRPEPKRQVIPYDAERQAQILDDFEIALATQTARINNRLTQHGNRVRQANKKTLNTGPLIVEGGSGIAYRGDDTDVEHKK